MKSNAADPLLPEEEEEDKHLPTFSDSYICFNKDDSTVFRLSRKYRTHFISFVICFILAGVCCLIWSSDHTSTSATTATAVSAATANSTPGSTRDLADSKKTIGGSKHVLHIDVNPTAIPLPPGQHDQQKHLPAEGIQIQLRPYKDTGINLPVMPIYGSSETARLGYDHVYVIHNLGHPERLVRMARLLQLLKITAEFVPVIQPPQALLQLHLPALNVSSTSHSPSLANIVEWHTRYRIYRDMANEGYRSALILDDSVDMELNIKTIMRAIHSHIPADWDMFFPGHCGAFESSQPKPSPDKLPSLRLANMPICLHAHAISHKGLMRLLHHLPQMPNSNEIISMAIMRLKEQGLLKMYSVDTPIFTPRPEEHSTNGSKRPAGNKKLDISAVDHLSLWRGKNGSGHQ
ncbi:hypothetical protein BX070DRAFT_251315 [Coemansia spiralis]|nr:hypothetical protein BX070DRAFT_251315 [Coemansia spiralis]KAJ1988213.1 hypothetical protein EDC05_005413 [Coemansia umbellata]